MQKIVSLFQRNSDGDSLVRDEVVPGAEWVLDGEGVATQKHVGTCCLVKNGKLFRRHEVKWGKSTPEGFIPIGVVDSEKQQGWVPVNYCPEDKWHREAFRSQGPGTYELCGPKIQGNPEKLKTHVLLPHGGTRLGSAPRSFDALSVWFRGRDIEGIVWHHEDGRMVKIKKKDFGIKRSE